MHAYMHANVYLNGRHGDRDMKVFAIVNGFHHSDAVRTLHILSWVLTGGYIYSRNYIASMRIEPTKCTSHGGSCQILDHVQLNQTSHGRFQHLLHHFFIDHSLTNHRLATPFYPVHRCWFLVGAIVSYTYAKFSKYMET